MKVESTFPLLRLLLRLPSPPHSLVSLAFSLSRLSSALPPSRFFPSPLNTMDTITLLPLLSQSLSSDPQTRRNAERQLANHEAAPGFLLSVLSIVQGAGEAPMEIRLAGGIYFKNAVRKMWAEESDVLVPSQVDRVAIKEQLVPVMISLSTPQLARLQAQVGEAVAAIAELDFPDQWEGLVQQLVSSISEDNFSINVGVLQTAHSIFKRWKSQFASDRLYSEILLVLSQFCQPYFELFKRTDYLLSLPLEELPPTTSLTQLAQTLLLLLQLFYDLNAQDLPEFFEENMHIFFGNPSVGDPGLLGKYLRFDREELRGDDEDPTPSPLQKIRSQICSILELFALRYSDAFPPPLLAPFVQSIWEFLASRSEGSTREDVLVCRALGFLGVVVKMGSHRELFEQEGTLEKFLQMIVLPNMSLRTHEEEMFEDDPIEFIRTDLEPSTESDTRRQAATDFTRALMEQFEAEVTTIVKNYISAYLGQYNANPAENWKSKDTAIYLLTSIASRGATIQHGVTSTNVLVDVVDFFSQNVFQDLQAEEGTVSVFLLVDAIKFLHTFRNQLTKDQLLSVMPLLIKHLSSSNYVVYSYAATTIERILFIKVNGQTLFSQADVRPFAQDVLMALFTNIERGQTPEKMAENDYLMRCVMRVILTARQTLTPVYTAILQRLVGIIGHISRNPSNPKFNQYTFESVSALIRFVAEGSPATLPTFESELFGPIMTILQQDVLEFVPYVFQILSQLLELHPVTSLPEAYQNLLGPLLTAALWEQRGNVPALVRLWKALLRRGADQIVANNQVQSLLGVFQKLISSSVNDIHGFALLQALFECVPISALQQYIRTILVLLSTRLQSSKTSNFTYSFVYFFCFVLAIQKEGLTPDFIVSQYESVQAGIFAGILQGIVIPQIPKMTVKDRKVVAVGVTNLLTHSQAMTSEPLAKTWPATATSVLTLLLLPTDLKSGSKVAASIDVTDDISALDFDDASGGFQSSFARLGASEAIKEDPVAYVTGDEKVYLKEELSKVAGGAVGPLLQQVDPAALARLQG